jgi:hypothetical protein
VSGRLFSDSHLLTASGVTLKRSASSSCVKPLFLRKSLILFPIVFVLCGRIGRYVHYYSSL